MNKLFESKKAILYRRNYDTFCLQFKTDVYIDLDEAKLLGEAFLKNSGGLKHFVIVMAKDIASNMNNQAMSHISNDPRLVEVVKGVGIILNNLSIRITAKTFMLIHKPPYPTKIFASEDKAEEWFETLRA